MDIINLSNYYLIVVLAPLASSIILGLFGTGFLDNFINKKYASIIAISGILVAFFSSCFVFYNVVNYGDVDINLYSWNIVGETTFNIGFLIDILSSIMMIIITFISLMVHVYTIGYMYKDDGYQRFFCYISLFTFSMLMLVMSNNMVQLFFGWEAVGLVSYLLIGFWHYKPTAVHANLKAFLINRVGDFGLLLGIILIFINTNSFDYKEILNSTPYIANNRIFILFYDFSVIKLSCWLLFMGAMAKSAQIPLHSWLPDSMEGPTPISALIHAATMVTAGIFLIVRLYILFEFSDELLSFITIMGSLSAVLMGILGIIQNDIKKIIAYSTLSQLGYMMVAIGISAYPIAIFHLLTHAFFKALLFLCAGSVIIGMHHDQNIKNMGGLYKYMPITCITFLIGSLSLIGIPFFSGFYSKEILIDSIKYSSIYGASFAYYSTTLGVLITSIYTFRLYMLVFHGKENFRSISSNIPHESQLSITLPLILLSIPSIFLGFFLVDSFVSNRSFINLYQHETMNLLTSVWLGNIKFAIHAFHEIQFYLIIFGLLLVLYKYHYIKNISFSLNLIKKSHILNKILKNNYYFDWINEKIIVPFFIKTGTIFYKIVDKKIIDGFFVNGNVVLVRYFYIFLSKLHSGYIYHYTFCMIAGIAIILSILLIK